MVYTRDEAKAYHRAYYHANPEFREERRVYLAAYRAEHKDELNRKGRERRARGTPEYTLHLLRNKEKYRAAKEMNVFLAALRGYASSSDDE